MTGYVYIYLYAYPYMYNTHIHAHIHMHTLTQEILSFIVPYYVPLQSAVLFSQNKMTKGRLVCYPKAIEEYIKNILRDQLGKQNLLSIHSKLKMLFLFRLSMYLS